MTHCKRCNIDFSQVWCPKCGCTAAINQNEEVILVTSKEPRFTRCPECKDEDVEIMDDVWVCWNCEWETPLTEEEKNDRKRTD